MTHCSNGVTGHLVLRDIYTGLLTPVIIWSGILIGSWLLVRQSLHILPVHCRLLYKLLKSIRKMNEQQLGEY